MALYVRLFLSTKFSLYRGGQIFLLCILTFWVQLGFSADLDFDSVPNDEHEFLPVEQAFVFMPDIHNWKMTLGWKIASNYYLYQDRIQAKADAIQPVKLDFDHQAELKNDPNFGEVKIFHEHLGASADLHSIKPKFMEVSYQGCSQAGLCYPVQTLRFRIDVAGNGKLVTDNIAENVVASAPKAQSGSLSPPNDLTESAGGIADFLKTSGFLGILGTFLLLGIGLSLTPCVLPMVPILSGIIAGQGERLSAQRGFTLASAYVLGMSASYAIAGVCVGYFGASANISASLQNPWVLTIFASIFVVLALSMFGFYELQLPSSVLNKLNSVNQQQQGGRLLSVGLMGALSALVVSPCVSAPLAGALIYISTTGDALLGGAALFALGIGMGVPLLLIGLGGGALVPKAGTWMLAVKAFFGVLLLAVALWMLSRFVPSTIMLGLWALLLMGSGIALGAFEKTGMGFGTLWRTLGVVSVCWASFMLIGAATGAANPFKPLEKLSIATNAVNKKTDADFVFTKITSNAQLQSALDQARAQAKPVLLDYYADWCTACLDMERTTFADARLHAIDTIIVEVDVTQNTRESTQLLQRFGLFAPPSMVFFNRTGEQQKSLTLMGEVSADTLLEKIALLQ